MFAHKFDLLLFVVLSHVLVSNCERRIVGGQVVASNQSYMVYLVKAEISSRNYDYWVCGGALVTVDFIITSAACVEDVDYLYAVAGYVKMIEDPATQDTCVLKIRKKVIFTCVPVSYKFQYDLLEKWSYIDIALVKVESPYDLEDTTYLEYCSYIPTIIPINYDSKYQHPGRDAMVLGWGSRKTWRMHGDTNNYNREYLHYAPTMIMDKDKCVQEYFIHNNMSQVIENYMICTFENGNIDEHGKPIVASNPTATGCSTQQKLLGLPGCDDEDKQHIDNTRRERTVNKTMHNVSMLRKRPRTNGICQNDHGGPLVTWVGTRKILIGIASVFKVTKHNTCEGPYLFTSTQCNGAFLDCVLTSEYLVTKKKTGRGAELCDSPPSVKGYTTIERKISWKDHPAGPAENEIKEMQEKNERLKFAEQEKYQTADRQPTNEKYIDNGRYIQTINYLESANEKNIDNGRYPENLNNPVNTNETNIDNGRYPENLNYPADASEKNVDNGRYKENLNYPINANDNIARMGGNGNIARMGANDNIARMSGNYNIARMGGNDNIARMGANANIARMGGNDNIARMGGNDNIARMGVNANIARMGGNDNIARMGANANIARMGGNDNIARMGGNDNIARMGNNNDEQFYMRPQRPLQN